MFRFGDPGGYPYGVATNFLTWWTGSSFFKDSLGIYIVTNGSRSGSANSLKLVVGSNSSGNNWCYVWKALDNQATYGIAFAFKTDVLISTPIAAFYDSSSLQCDIRLASDGSLTVTRNGTSLGNAPAGTVTLNNWVHIELKITFNSSSGTVYLGINGVQVLNLSSQNTRNTTNNSANTIYFGPSAPPSVTNMNTQYCDIIVYDGQSTDPNGKTDITGPIGDCSLLPFFPNGAGTTTQFTPSAGSNYSCVNESTPNGDATYVSDSNVNDIDTYALPDLPSSVTTILSMATFAYSRKDSSGSRSIGHELRSGSTNYTYTTTIALSSSYTYSFSNWGSNPSGVSWTPTTINSLEVGQKVTA